MPHEQALILAGGGAISASFPLLAGTSVHHQNPQASAMAAVPWAWLFQGGAAEAGGWSALVIRSRTALLPDEVAGDPPALRDRPVLPQVNPLPDSEEQAAPLHAERHGLGRECRTNVRRHVVVALVVV